MMDAQPYNPWAAPVYPGQNDNAMQPETYANPLASHFFNGMVDSINRLMNSSTQRPDTSQEQVRYTTASPLVNITDEDINRGINVGMSAGPGMIKAYHGSPHNFDAFDLSKVGTRTDGGGTTFGRGLYFADDPKAAKIYSGAEGKNYEVNINADPNEFLQWHTAEQSPLAQKAIADLPSPKLGPEIPFGQDAKFVQDKNGSWALDTGTTKFPMRQSDVDRLFGKEGEPLTGGQAYRRAASQIGEEEVANRLRANGVNGIRYPDEHRLSGSNYSILNPDIIDILRKYAIPGMVGAPIFGNAMGEQKP